MGILKGNRKDCRTFTIVTGIPNGVLVGARERRVVASQGAPACLFIALGTEIDSGERIMPVVGCQLATWLSCLL